MAVVVNDSSSKKHMEKALGEIFDNGNEFQNIIFSFVLKFFHIIQYLPISDLLEKLKKIPGSENIN